MKQMTTTDVSKIGRAWTDLLNEELSDPAECLDYLQHIADHEPAMASIALTDVLEACPQIAAGCHFALCTSAHRLAWEPERLWESYLEQLKRDQRR